jgi:hypothetical protein
MNLLKHWRRRQLSLTLMTSARDSWSVLIANLSLGLLIVWKIRCTCVKLHRINWLFLDHSSSYSDKIPKVMQSKCVNTKCRWGSKNHINLELFQDISTQRYLRSQLKILAQSAISLMEKLLMMNYIQIPPSASMIFSVIAKM